MIDLNTYKKLKNTLESEEFNSIIEKTDQPVTRRIILKKALCFLITTREYDNLIFYMNNYLDNIFPYQYFYDKKISKEETENIIWENYIKNGFLFHVTPQKNQENILSNGLLSLNDIYHCNFYEKSQKINQIYQNIKKRNKHAKMFFKDSLFNIPQDDFTQERCQGVYLSSNLEYILKFYGNSSEFAYLFVYDLITAFKINSQVSDINPDNILPLFLETIKKNKLNIHNKELTEIIDFFNLIYESFPNYKEAERTLILIPTNTIISNSPTFKYYQKQPKDISSECIIDINDGEIISNGSINPENIITIHDTPSKKLCLRKKE